MKSPHLQLISSALLAAPIALLLIAACAYILPAIGRFDAWNGLWDAPSLLQAIGMTLWTGLASSLLAWWLTAWLLSQAFGRPWWNKLVRSLPPLLATPHAAFAVGLVFLIAPSGWILRSISPWLTGYWAPPQIATSQDTYGLGLIAMLVLKEVPFLLWAAATQLQRDDTGARWQREAFAAQTLGYSRQRAFWQVLWPQLSNRLFWPLLAVLAYGLTVVDAALIAGPGSPATLSVRAWQWLQDSDEEANAIGAVAGWLLTALVAATAALIVLHDKHSSRLWLRFNGQRSKDAAQSSWPAGRVAWGAVLLLYGAVLLALAVGSVAGVWPFPALLPKSWSWEAWGSVMASSRSVWMTLALGITSSAIALAWSIAWLEISPPSWDRALRKLLYLPLLLPGVLWVVGIHRLALAGGLTGAWLGVLLAHLLSVLPYTLIALSPAYQAFDARYAHINATLGKSRWVYLSQVKWPLLRSSLWSTAAVGFAVSVAQFLPTLYIGEGRIVTVTTEAVTLSSGGQRSLVAAFAWLQWLLPALAFALAAWLGKPRRWAIKASILLNNATPSVRPELVEGISKASTSSARTEQI
ncbi:ABC transporter permease [Variovorax sp. PCZ-1]|uniref:ABC transporter permease n=1 Tax=Variovorax sp. PCZ-1 TaxID=2835533 RepID=UPI001BCFB066|nr:ABC transporter permease [Variovorax sp. PCZ-1]MBS7807448.1 ABC transporter permease [Variovorax sp. PCZ-1]